MTSNYPWPTIIVPPPVPAGLLIPSLPSSHGGNKIVRRYTLGICSPEFPPITHTLCYHFESNSPFVRSREDYDRINLPSDSHRRLGIDGLPMGLIPPTGLVTVSATPAARPVTRSPRSFHPLMLAMHSGQVGLFASQDTPPPFLVWEPELIPAHSLLRSWGGKRRPYAATKFIPYTAGGPISLSAGAITMGLYVPGEPALDFRVLADRSHPAAPEMVSYLSFPMAHAVKPPILPLHARSPDTHGEAHYSTRTLPAGALLKMGGHGPIRINMESSPRAHSIFAPGLAVVGATQIVCAALISLNQRSVKRRIAHPPVSHMGPVPIGIGPITEIGPEGAILQMISHGSTGAAPFPTGGTGCDRMQTPFLGRMGGIAILMPRIFITLSSLPIASSAPPGMSGSAAESMVSPGVAGSKNRSYDSKIIVLATGAIGVILTPIHPLSMPRQMPYGHSRVSTAPAVPRAMDSGPREISIPIRPLLPVIGIGLYPNSVLSLCQGGIYPILRSLE
uniref:NADH dehydrogenase subunit 4 n=1 Tax=Selaginella pallidissima TaxID=1715389 RepID=A0A7U3VJF8_9TRAC|nr:NADH dehydrogenase subunit 4 [Selaginella pallidissima]QQP00358.1 NADH dehydrogenase subunit 4 [Selaginella pallidissima]